MKNQIMGLYVAGGFFGLLALAQLTRLILRADIVVNTHHVPLWPSMLAFVVLAGLCWWMLELAHLARPKGGNGDPAASS